MKKKEKSELHKKKSLSYTKTRRLMTRAIERAKRKGRRGEEWASRCRQSEIENQRNTTKYVYTTHRPRQVENEKKVSSSKRPTTAMWISEKKKKFESERRGGWGCVRAKIEDIFFLFFLFKVVDTLSRLTLLFAYERNFLLYSNNFPLASIGWCWLDSR